MSEKDYPMIGSKEAWELLKRNPAAVLIDVRSEMEYLMVGHPKGAINVPWIDEPEWTVNPHFVPELRKIMLGRLATHEHPEAPILLICRSNNRSADAAAKLISEGITNVYVVKDGFEGPLDQNHHRGTLAGWRFEGLPWEQC